MRRVVTPACVLSFSPCRLTVGGLTLRLTTRQVLDADVMDVVVRPESSITIAPNSVDLVSYPDAKDVKQGVACRRTRHSELGRLSNLSISAGAESTPSGACATI